MTTKQEYAALRAVYASANERRRAAGLEPVKIPTIIPMEKALQIMERDQAHIAPLFPGGEHLFSVSGPRKDGGWHVATCCR